MSLQLLDSYFDASGKEKSDRLITVNGCLSTPEKWRDFDSVWQETLRGFNFAPDKETGRFLFHTTDFHSGYCKLMPKGLRTEEKHKIYRTLLNIVREHSLFIVGFAVSLRDYRRFRELYPFIVKERFGQPGTFCSILSFGKCIEWAKKKAYSPSISIMFDRNDEFWGAMHQSFKAFVKTKENEFLGPDSLLVGNKAIHSPIQAADIVAWECQRHWKKYVNKIMPSGCKLRKGLEILTDPSYFDLFEFDGLGRRVLEIEPNIPDIETLEAAIYAKYKPRIEMELQRREERRLEQEQRRNENKNARNSENS